MTGFTIYFLVIHRFYFHILLLKLIIEDSPESLVIFHATGVESLSRRTSRRYAAMNSESCVGNTLRKSAPFQVDTLVSIGSIAVPHSLFTRSSAL